MLNTNVSEQSQLETIPKAALPDAETTHETVLPAVETTPDTLMTEAGGVTEAPGGDGGSKAKEHEAWKWCLGRNNKGVSWGKIYDQGYRQSMEDNVAVYPTFLKLTCNEFGGCTAPACKYAQKKSPIHFFGVFDGHGGPQVTWWSYLGNLIIFLL